jgi:hypothetical protein
MMAGGSTRNMSRVTTLPSTVNQRGRSSWKLEKQPRANFSSCNQIFKAGEHQVAALSRYLRQPVFLTLLHWGTAKDG